MLSLKEALDRLEERREAFLGFNDEELYWIYPLVESAPSEQCTRFTQVLLDCDKEGKLAVEREGNILNRVLYHLFFQGKHQYKEGTTFDQFHERALSELSESSALRLAFEELEFWAFK